MENEFSTLLSTMASVYTQPVLLIAGGAAVPDAIEIDDTVVNATETVELDICVEHITNDIEVATYGAGLSHIGDSQNVPGVGKSMSLTISFTPTVAGEVLGAYLLIFSPADHWCHYIPITAKGVSE